MNNIIKKIKELKIIFYFFIKKAQIKCIKIIIQIDCKNVIWFIQNIGINQFHKIKNIKGHINSINNITSKIVNKIINVCIFLKLIK